MPLTGSLHVCLRFHLISSSFKLCDYSNRNTYPQAGTYWYDRANWGPGLPLNVQYWTITDLPEDGRLTIDFNLERFKSEHTALNAEGLAQYIIQVDAFGFEK